MLEEHLVWSEALTTWKNEEWTGELVGSLVVRSADFAIAVDLAVAAVVAAGFEGMPFRCPPLLQRGETTIVLHLVAMLLPRIEEHWQFP